jgi:hypothetical protein
MLVVWWLGGGTERLSSAALTDWMTDWLIAWLTDRPTDWPTNKTNKQIPSYSTVRLEKLEVTYPAKKKAAFYGNQRFITVATEARHLSYWDKQIQTSASSPT